MALHKIIEYAHDLHADDILCPEEEYDALPAHEEDDDYDTIRDIMFEDHDVLMLFQSGTAKFVMGKVDPCITGRPCNQF